MHLCRVFFSSSIFSLIFIFFSSKWKVFDLTKRKRASNSVVSPQREIFKIVMEVLENMNMNMKYSFSPWSPDVCWWNCAEGEDFISNFKHKISQKLPEHSLVLDNDPYSNKTCVSLGWRWYFSICNLKVCLYCIFIKVRTFNADESLSSTVRPDIFL